MKKLIYIIFAALTLSSCNDWLEATSSTQFKAEEIFGSREGVLDALSGVYINMGTDALYGANLTWKYNDLMVYPYESFTSVILNGVQQHAFTTDKVKQIFASSWAASYNVIANVNMILDNSEDFEHVFSSKSEYNWVIGELLAIRAYMHFDLIRLFGVEYLNDTNIDYLTIPYALHYSKEAADQLTYRETLELLSADLGKALELLADDPVTGVVPEGFDTGINAEGYWNKREKHLNFFAVKALSARVLAWSGNLEAAATLAKEVIDGAFASEAVKWVDINKYIDSSTTNDSRDWAFASEHLFQLEITGLNTNAMQMLIPGGTASRADDYFYLDPNWVMGMFNIYNQDLSALEDVRGIASMLKYASGAYVSYKLYGTNSSYYRNSMPLIRITEMYLIAAENELLNENFVEAYAYLDEIRHHRGISSDLKVPEKNPADEYLSEDDAYRLWLEHCYSPFVDEYAKEFLNEGQYFYFFKLHFNSATRHNYLLRESLTHYWTRTISSSFVLPYPDEEIIYGRVQQID